MADTIKVMNWNIEQFGIKRASDKKKIKLIAELIIDKDPDILSIVELKTTNAIVAIEIANTLLSELGNKYRFIISYKNLLETYCFFYKVEKVIPVCIESGISTVLTQSQLLDQVFVEADGKNTVIDWSEEHFNYYFPLMEYSKEREMNNMRPPCAGFFKIKNTKKYFSLIAWHNAAGGMFGGDRVPKREMKNLADVDYIKSKEIKIKIKGEKEELSIKNILLSGDFNVDYLKDNRVSCYTAFKGFTTVFTKEEEKTHLKIHNTDNDNVFKGFKDLKSSLFDNFIITDTVKFSNPIVVDLPEYIHKKGYVFIKELLKENDFCDQIITEKTIKSETQSNIINLFVKNRVGKNKTNKAMKKQSKMQFTLGAMAIATQNELKRILEQDDLANDVILTVNVNAKRKFILFNKVKLIIESEKNLVCNDLLLISRKLYSDHFPTIVDISL